MSKPEWGTKHRCQSCGIKFYDLQRAPITCPSCGAKADRKTPPKRTPPKSWHARSSTAAPKPVPVESVKTPQPVDADADGEKDEELGDVVASKDDDEER